ncbi:MAG: SufS family cysteine desulfurase [Pirellulaceae bacterium]|jgi:cysteine desulfurase/selenocysteine lyase
MKTQIPSVWDVEQARACFPVLQRMHPNGSPLAYLDNAATTHKPLVVLEAMDQCYRAYYANVHRGIHFLSEESSAAYEDARIEVAKFLHAQRPEEVVFTSGCTGSINLVAHSWGNSHVGPGDTLVVTEMEHHANLVPWFQLAQRTGAKTVMVPVLQDGHLDLERLEAILATGPKLLAISALSNVLGIANPISELVLMARQYGVTVLVDAAQAVAHHAIDVGQWGADFVVFSAHKMMGPTGIGVLWGRHQLLQQMQPFLGGGGMIDEVFRDGFTAGEVPTRFEAGTPPIVEAIGLAIACREMSRWFAQGVELHVRQLVDEAWQRLSALDGVSILGPEADARHSLISFTVEGVHAHDVAQMLDRVGVAVRAGHHCAMPLHERFQIAASCRASFFGYNRLEEVERLVEGLRESMVRFRDRKQVGRQRTDRQRTDRDGTGKKIGDQGQAS